MSHTAEPPAAHVPTAPITVISFKSFFSFISCCLSHPFSLASSSSFLFEGGLNPVPPVDQILRGLHPVLITKVLKVLHGVLCPMWDVSGLIWRKTKNIGQILFLVPSSQCRNPAGAYVSSYIPVESNVQSFVKMLNCGFNHKSWKMFWHVAHPSLTATKVLTISMCRVG